MTPDDAAADLRFGELAVSEVSAALQHLERARLLFALVEDNAAGMAAIHDLLRAEEDAGSAIARFESRGCGWSLITSSTRVIPLNIETRRQPPEVRRIAPRPPRAGLVA